MAAKDIRAYRTLSAKLVRLEERGKIIGNLIALGIGFKEEEEFVRHEASKFRTSKNFGKKKEIIRLVMSEKLRDNHKIEGKTRKLRNKTLGKIENSMGKNSRPCRGLRKEVRSHCQGLRSRLRENYRKKEQFLVSKERLQNEKTSYRMTSSLKAGGASGEKPTFFYF